ncbi:hypothetical protein GALMADRAFT_215939 [Galerina marginata CBS 339.88]|uniref:Uncharacterized protein n=1 Tax=Galerina marginata (strain CBS 339.88) TaxID=685588 RepID=A0A067SBH9_GALM3|nr:hypothetical protein GALMADRAFT_215939 [Galerina marginata CBS 339.88]
MAVSAMKMMRPIFTRPRLRIASEDQGGRKAGGHWLRIEESKGRSSHPAAYNASLKQVAEPASTSGSARTAFLHLSSSSTFITPTRRRTTKTTSRRILLVQHPKRIKNGPGIGSDGEDSLVERLKELAAALAMPNNLRKGKVFQENEEQAKLQS